MDKETLRMQMLSGVITESEYKQKLEEKSPFSGEKMDLSLIKNIEWPDFVLQELEQDFPQIDFKTLVIGNLFPEEGPNDGAREAEVVSAKDLKGNDVDKKTLKKLNSRNRYEIRDIVLNNWDPYWKSQKKKKSLNEHYVAGGIVGIGAINQIPSRTKAVYEDAFEHFLGQKYSLNEEEDVEEGKEVEEPTLYEEDLDEARISPDNAVAYLENTLGHVWNMGTGKNDIDLQSLAQSIAQDLGLIEDLEEGKEVEEPYNY
jgi:hypothetical protein